MRQKDRDAAAAAVYVSASSSSYYDASQKKCSFKIFKNSNFFWKCILNSPHCTHTQTDLLQHYLQLTTQLWQYPHQSPFIYVQHDLLQHFRFFLPRRRAKFRTLRTERRFSFFFRIQSLLMCMISVRRIIQRRYVEFIWLHLDLIHRLCSLLTLPVSSRSLNFRCTFFLCVSYHTTTTPCKQQTCNILGSHNISNGITSCSDKTQVSSVFEFQSCETESFCCDLTRTMQRSIEYLCRSFFDVRALFSSL